MRVPSALALILLPAAALCGSSPEGPRTVVTLTFDDGTQDHALAGDLLARHGMRGTFYINTGRVGTRGYLSWSQVRDLAERGHEIAGHTANHANVTTLPDGARRAQICGDRDELLRRGYRAVSFAYPFGAADGPSSATVQECGYLSGRIVGGLTCRSCPKAEVSPPASPFLVRTPDSIKSSTTLSDMQRYVTEAEESGGGWVPLVFHRVCESCDRLATSPETLSAFLAWLKGRAGSGTVVRTMAEAMGHGDPPPPPGSGPPPVSAADPSFRFRDLYAFPNPSRRGERVIFRLQVGLADSVELNVYDISGRLVHRASFGRPELLDDGNGKGAQYTYDYPWDVGAFGSGVYIYAVTARKAGQADIRKVGKSAVLK